MPSVSKSKVLDNSSTSSTISISMESTISRDSEALGNISTFGNVLSIANAPALGAEDNSSSTCCKEFLMSSFQEFPESDNGSSEMFAAFEGHEISIE